MGYNIIYILTKPVGNDFHKRIKILSYQFFWHVIKWKGNYKYDYYNNMMNTCVSSAKMIECLGVATYQNAM